jgi:hypothetical protein
MALTERQKAYFRAYREAHKVETAAAFKRWHESHGKDRYYQNLELTRAIKRKHYYTSIGNLEQAADEQALIEQLRVADPRKQAGRKVQFTPEERVVRRKACVRKARYRHVQGIPSFDEPPVCEVCGSGRKICMDHDHATSEFRGWLCDDCNVALGLVKDRIEVLEAMILYLKKSL